MPKLIYPPKSRVSTKLRNTHYNSRARVFFWITV